MLGVVHHPNGGQKATFVEMGPAPPADRLTPRVVLNALLSSMGPAGRVLQMIQQDPMSSRHMLVGTADQPIDVDGGFMHHSHNFRELGSWGGVAADEVHAMMSPLPASTARTQMLHLKRVPDTTDVYVIYIYHEVSLD